MPSHAKVLYEYKAEGDNEVNCSADEIVEVLVQNGDWWYCNGSHGKGYVPASFLEVVDSGSSEIPAESEAPASEDEPAPVDNCRDCKVEITSEFYMVGKHLDRKVCRRCKDRERCVSCDIIIYDSVMEVDGKLFHKQCFRCSMCRKTLPASFVERKGEFLCKPCASGEGEKMTGAAAAIKEVGETCPGCKKELKTGTFMRACNARWHEECFVCQDCRKPFPDDVFNNVDGLPYCDVCHAKQKKLQRNYRLLTNQDSPPPPASGRRARTARSARSARGTPRKYVTGGYKAKRSTAWNDMDDDL